MLYEVITHDLTNFLAKRLGFSQEGTREDLDPLDLRHREIEGRA